MKQKTFLGFDITPRWELWEKIEDLTEELELEKGQCSELEDHNRHLRDKADKLTSENQALRQQLKNANPQRGKNGRFAKKK